MRQIHTRFTADQVKALLKGYDEGSLDRLAVEEMLEIGRSRMFALLKQYREDRDKFSITYSRLSPARLAAGLEEEIEKQLMVERGLIDDPTLPITTYNYSAIRDRLAKRELRVSLSTIIARAKDLECYQAHPNKEGPRSRSSYHYYRRSDPTRCLPPSLVSLCQGEMGSDHLLGRLQPKTLVR